MAAVVVVGAVVCGGSRGSCCGGDGGSRGSCL